MGDLRAHAANTLGGLSRPEWVLFQRAWQT